MVPHRGKLGCDTVENEHGVDDNTSSSSKVKSPVALSNEQATYQLREIAVPVVQVAQIIINDRVSRFFLFITVFVVVVVVASVGVTFTAVVVVVVVVVGVVIGKRGSTY